jgi:hypothetical protein
MLDAARGTIFFLDWRWLRARNEYDRYVSRIQPVLRSRLLAVTAGDWVPVEILHAHYRALDAMGFTREQTLECGVSVGEALHGSMLRTLVRLASHLGATPWTVMAQAPKLWSRTWRGGGFLSVRLGDKSARLDIVKNPAARSAFHRGSVSGVTSVGIGWVCEKHVIQEIDGARTDDSFSLQVDWI